MEVVHAKGLVNLDGKASGLSDPYVVLTFPDKKTKRTKEISNCLNPIWKERVVKDINVDYGDD